MVTENILPPQKIIGRGGVQRQKVLRGGLVSRCCIFYQRVRIMDYMVGCICDKICKFVSERLSGNTVYNSLSRLQEIRESISRKAGQKPCGGW